MSGEAAAIAIMAFATYLTRVAGIWIVGFIRLTPRRERALQHLSSSVLAALVFPAVVRGDPAMWIGMGVACLAMALTRRPLAALLLGVACAAAIRWADRIVTDMLC
jgi:uncharacterized membrane protein